MADAGKGRRRRQQRKEPDGKRREELIRAVDHRVRRRVVRALSESRAPRSPAELAPEFGLPVGMVSYHVQVLRECGGVEPAGERTVRGAVEHFYESAIGNDPPIETLLEETREADESDD